MKALKWV